MVGAARAAGAVFELFHRVALHAQQAAGFEGAPQAGEQALAQGRVGELHEDGHGGVESTRRPAPFIHRGDVKVHRYAALLRPAAGFIDGDGREVEGGDVVALLGQPDGIAAFAVGRAENAAGGRKTRGFAHQKGVGLGAVVQPGLGEAGVPGFARIGKTAGGRRGGSVGSHGGMD